MPGVNPNQVGAGPSEVRPSGGDELSDYLRSLPPIYQDVLSSFPVMEPSRRKGDGLAFQTIFAGLGDRYSLGEVRSACLELQRHGVVEIRNQIFAHPTESGEEWIARLTGKVPPEVVPPLPPPPVSRGGR